MLRPVLQVLFVLGLIVTSSAASAERRVALVIGNSAYRNTLALPNPGHDAADIAAALRKVGFAVSEGHDLDKRGMDDAFRTFARTAASADVALFYYSGHGLQFQGANYLMPVDAKLEGEEDLPYEMSRVDDIVADLQRASGVRILMLDACRDNPLAQQLQARLGASRSAGLSRGLARLEQTAGVIIAYATQPGAVAADGSGRNSPFAAAFLGEVDKPGLEVGRMFRRIARSVYDGTGGKQLPEVSLSVLGDFYFAGPGKDGTEPPEAGAGQVAVVAPPPLAPRAGLDAAAQATVDFCDKAAASPQDVDRPSGVAGLEFNKIDPPKAVGACRAAVAAAPGERRVLYQLGRALDAAGSDAEARDYLGKAADAGSISAKADLALMLETGEGGAKDLPRAVALFDEAAAAGDVPAMRNVAIEFENGTGRPRDAAQAAQWYRKAADTGDPQAMGFLATLYLQGTGVPKDAGQARQWLDKLVETEHTATMLRVGYVLLGSTGAVKDLKTARRLFERAVELGDGDGELMLGNMAANGIGGARDLSEARRRFEKAKALGSVNAGPSLMPFLMTGLGGAGRDVDKAADYGLDGLRAGSPVARSLLIDKAETSLTPPMRLAVEKRLAFAGLLKRRPDGSYGADTKAALQAWVLARP